MNAEGVAAKRVDTVAVNACEDASRGEWTVPAGEESGEVVDARGDDLRATCGDVGVAVTPGEPSGERSGDPPPPLTSRGKRPGGAVCSCTIGSRPARLGAARGDACGDTSLVEVETTRGGGITRGDGTLPGDKTRGEASREPCGDTPIEIYCCAAGPMPARLGTRRGEETARGDGSMRGEGTLPGDSPASGVVTGDSYIGSEIAAK